MIEEKQNKAEASFSRPLLESLDTGFKFLRWIVLVLVAVYCFSNTTVIKSDEVAIVLRFGKPAGASPAEHIKQPGLLFAFPRPIDNIIRVKIKRIYEMEIQDLRYNAQQLEGEARSLAELDYNTGSIDPEREGYCLTGDSNVVQPFITIKYQITDPVAYSFRQQEPENLLRDVIMASMVRTVGEMSVDDVLTEGKKQLTTAVLTRAQARLDQVNSGIVIQAVELNEIVPPRHVMQDFKNVQNAFIDRETKIKESNSYMEEEIPRAEAEREAMLREADAYAADLLATARGEAGAFREIVTEYKDSPRVVRERLYREAIEGSIGWSGRAAIIPVPAGGKYSDRYDQLRIAIPGE